MPTTQRVLGTVWCLPILLWSSVNAQVHHYHMPRWNFIDAASTTVLSSSSDAGPSSDAASVSFSTILSSTPVDNTPSCSQCSLFYKYANVYYWPETSADTACLGAVTSVPTSPLPSGPTDIHSPSVYVIFPEISAGNACTRVGNVYTDVTMSFAPGELSTIEGLNGPTKVFNFADLPCPPSAVASGDSYFYNPQVNPGQAYAPLLAPLPELFALDPAFSSCITAEHQGFDPPMAFPTAARESRPDHHHGPPLRHRRARAHVPNVPWTPVETNPPA